MSYPRLVIPFANAFLVRYLLHTGMLKALSEFSSPIVLLRWENNALKKDLMEAGAEVYPLPAFRFGNEYEHFRRRKIYWHKQQRNLRSTNIDRRRYLVTLSTTDKFKRLTRDAWIDFELRLPGRIESLIREEEEVYWKETNACDFKKLLHHIKADAVFSITPFLIDEEPLLRASKQIELPMITSILSFDNLTTKDPIPVIFDLYCVWNRHNADEVQRFYPESQNSRTVITGPPQFDFYAQNKFLLSRGDWMKHNGIQGDTDIILFGGGVKRVSPNEPCLLFQIHQAIESGEIKGKPSLLFRKHPLDDEEERWVFLKNSANVFIDRSWSANNFVDHDSISSNNDIVHFVSTLFHSQVHINSASTLTVDGSFFNRPQIGPAYDDGHGWEFNRVAREVYQQEHFLPIVQAGGLSIAFSRTELVESINDALQTPDKLASERRKILEEICTFTDGCSTQRVVKAVAKNLGVNIDENMLCL